MMEISFVDYSVTAGSRLVANIAKQLLSWGDTYTLDISDPGDEIMALMLVIAMMRQLFAE